MSITLISFLGFGFLLGLRHASDADHVVAVATIVSRQRKLSAAAFTGILWGLGHSLSLLLLGGLIILSGLTVPERVGLGLELGVAAMLVFLGTVNLRAGWRSHSGHDSHTPPPTDGKTHPFFFWLPSPLNSWGPAQMLRPLLIGIVHGLAGSAAVTLLVIPLIPQPLWAFAYLALFGLGTLAGMMLLTMAVGLPFLSQSTATSPFHRRLTTLTGLLSLLLGLSLAYQIGFVQGLFLPTV